MSTDELSVMLRHQQIEYELLRLAIDATDSAGYSNTLSGINNILAPHFHDPPLKQAELVDSIKQLASHDYLKLQKWESSLGIYRDYRGDRDDARFFYSNNFQLRRTPSKPDHKTLGQSCYFPA